MVSSILLSSLLPLLPIVSAHFELEFPKVRGFDEKKLTQFPCGGQDQVSDKRTPWPLQGRVPIQLDMGHDESLVQVLMAMGNDPGDNFNIVVVPTLQEMGLGEFCLENVKLPDDLKVKAGMNATIQVVTNGDPDGGLYNCADITFTDAPLSDSDYANNCDTDDQVETKTIDDPTVNANGTTTTSSAPTESSSQAAGTVNVERWLLGAAGLAGGLAAL